MKNSSAFDVELLVFQAYAGLVMLGDWMSGRQIGKEEDLAFHARVYCDMAEALLSETRKRVKSGLQTEKKTSISKKKAPVREDDDGLGPDDFDLSEESDEG